MLSHGIKGKFKESFMSVQEYFEEMYRLLQESFKHVLGVINEVTMVFHISFKVVMFSFTKAEP